MNYAKSRKTSGIRFLSGVMALVIVAFLLLSIIFIVHEADHDCSGGDCPVCALIMQCENNLRTVGTGDTAEAVSSVTSILIAVILMPLAAVAVVSTPISRKIRLNN